MPVGQITRGCQFGTMLYELAKSNTIHNIVEFGTWSGCGSTKCIIDGIIDSKTPKSFISLEIWPEMHKEATVNLTNSLSYVQLVHGTIINPEEMMPFTELPNENEKREWYDRDFEYIKKAPNVFHLIPPTIDLLVLDGGAWTTYPEWNKLKSRTKTVAMDDTRTVKTREVRADLLIDENFVVVKDDLNERNGYSIFRRK